jgi:hypothetical protein
MVREVKCLVYVNRYGDIRYIKPINGISVCPSGIPTVKRFFGIWMRQCYCKKLYIYMPSALMEQVKEFKSFTLALRSAAF